MPQSIHPPRRTTRAGRMRRVGVEIEMTGLDVAQIADQLRASLGGTVELETDYQARVSSPMGEFVVEADMELLRRVGAERASSAKLGVSGRARHALAPLAEHLAPFEIISPPLTYPLLPQLDALADDLRARGGRGTKDGLLSALGLHLNPDLPEESAESLHAHARSFAVLEPWLRSRRAPDASRRATPYLDPYPLAYVRRLLETPGPRSLEEFCDLYLAHNPTRNRALDLLPALLHLCPQRVRASVGDERVKARPTFHYRLPDSKIGDPDWSITDEWRHWLVVERLAADGEALERCARACRSLLEERVLPFRDQKWIRICEQELG